jgi:hypothetical protein
MMTFSIMALIKFTLGMIAFGMATYSFTKFSAVFNAWQDGTQQNATQQNCNTQQNTQYNVILSIAVPKVVLLSVLLCCVALG